MALEEEKPLKLHLSQDLRINNRYTISVPEETEHYFGECTIEGKADWLPVKDVWYALTDKAREVWKGDTQIESEIVLGLLYHEE